MEVKKGVPFAESSPYLDNVSGAASWEKVAGGLVKMYKVEILGKHPVIKHQYFGTIIEFWLECYEWIITIYCVLITSDVQGWLGQLQSVLVSDNACSFIYE